jgi:hypothetical protein
MTVANAIPILSLSVTELPPIPKDYPFHRCTPHQLKLFNELQQFLVAIISRDPVQGEKERKWCTDACLLRYLRASKWDVGTAMMRLKDTLVWRRHFKPDEITMDDIKDQAVTGKQFLNGFDKEGHPILYIIPERENSKDFDAQLKFIAFNMERAIKIMPPGVEKIMLIIDYAKMKMDNAPPLSVCKKFLKMMGDHYPERLANLWIINPASYIWIFAKLITPFLDPVTKSKFYFMEFDNTKDHKDTKIVSVSKGTGGWGDIRLYVDKNMLIKDYGGDQEFYWDFETYWKFLAII